MSVGRVVELAEREFMVRGLGYVKDVRDLENIVLTAGPGGVPVLLKDVAQVSIGSRDSPGSCRVER